MTDLLEAVAQADAEDLEQLLHAVRMRYAILFPDWELSILSLQKNADQTAQIDALIAMLEKRKCL